MQPIHQLLEQEAGRSICRDTEEAVPCSVKAVTLFTADKNDPVKLEFAEAGGAVKFTVPEMEVYSMVVVG